MHTLSFMALGLAGYAAATGYDWRHAQAQKCPTQIQNECTDLQKSGFDWKDVPEGSFSQYGQFSFKGFDCSNGKLGRRALFPRTQFQSKCIKGQASKKPSFSCGKDFSIHKYQVTVDKDMPLQFTYNMGNGKTCKHVTPCSSQGNEIENTQCGGARGVTVHPPEGSKQDCHVGIHSIQFHCGPPPPQTTLQPPPPGTTLQPPPPPGTTTQTSAEVSTTTAVAQTTTGFTTTSAIAIVGSTTTAAPPPNTTPPPPPPPPPSNQTTVPPPPMTTSTITSTISSTITSCGSEVKSCPVGQVTVYTTQLTTVCPVTATNTPPPPPPPGSVPPGPPAPPPPATTPAPPAPPPPATTPAPPGPPPPAVSTSALPIASTLTTAAAPPPPGPPAPPPPGPPAPPAPPAPPVPTLLPSCIETFVKQAGCKDNTDASCYCKLAPFTQQLCDCLQAYNVDQAELQQAVSYFMGICAPHIPANPAMMTQCPSVQPPPPPPVVTSGAANVPPPAPVTTISVVQTVTATQGPPATISTVITVPQVGFTTGSGPEATVGLVPAAPAVTTGPAPAGPVPVDTSAAAVPGVPAPTGAAPPTGAGVPPVPSSSPIQTAAAAGFAAPGIGSLAAVLAVLALL